MFYNYNLVVDNYFNSSSNYIADDIIKYLYEEINYEVFSIKDVDSKQLLNWNIVHRYPNALIYLTTSKNNLYVSNLIDQYIDYNSSINIDFDIQEFNTYTGLTNRVIFTNGNTAQRVDNIEGLKVFSITGQSL